MKSTMKNQLLLISDNKTHVSKGNNHFANIGYRMSVETKCEEESALS